MPRWLGILFTMILVSLGGCSKGPKDAGKKPDVARIDNAGKPVPAQPVGRAKMQALRPFVDSVVLDPAPEDELQPPDQTNTGKNAVKIFESIANDLWDKANFADTQGRPIRYQAVLTTELGEIHIDLYGRRATSHVRSFVSLARAGYYDGMSFYYSIHRSVEGNTVAYIETGCLRGTGAYGSGSIGYWLKPEISESLSLDEGVLVACQNRDPNSASCRFFLTAAPMPHLNGQFTVFGKVTRGLDIVRTINKKTVQEYDRLAQPVVIRSVRIETAPE